MKAILISLVLAISPASVRTEIGVVVNCETIDAGGHYWGQKTEIKPETPVVVYFDTKGTETVIDDEIVRMEPIM